MHHQLFIKLFIVIYRWKDYCLMFYMLSLHRAHSNINRTIINKHQLFKRAGFTLCRVLQKLYPVSNGLIESSPLRISPSESSKFQGPFSYALLIKWSHRKKSGEVRPADLQRHWISESIVLSSALLFPIIIPRRKRERKKEIYW